MEGSDEHYSIVFLSKEDFLGIAKNINFGIFEDKVKDFSKINYKVIEEFEELV